MIKTIQLTIRSALFFLIIPLFSIIFTLISILFVRFIPYRYRFRYLTIWSRTVIFLAKAICGINYVVTGIDNIPKHQPFVILSKHQSEWETFFLVNFFQPVTIICKKELLKLPLGVGYGIRLLEPIPIDRADPKGSLKTLQREGLNSLQKKQLPVLIFPEGKRISLGKKGQYAKSGAQLAITAQLPILCISHNAGICWPDKGFLKYPGTIRVHISPAMETANRDYTAKTLTNKAETWIETELSLMPNTRE